MTNPHYEHIRDRITQIYRGGSLDHEEQRTLEEALTWLDALESIEIVNRAIFDIGALVRRDVFHDALQQFADTMKSPAQSSLESIWMRRLDVVVNRSLTWKKQDEPSLGYAERFTRARAALDEIYTIACGDQDGLLPAGDAGQEQAKPAP